MFSLHSFILSVTAIDLSHPLPASSQSPWTSKRVAVHVDSRCTSRLRRADGLSPLTVFDTDVTKASEGGCSEVAVVFGATLFGCPGHREPLSRAAAVLVWAPAHHGARSRRAVPIATRPHPAPPAIPASPLPPHPLALWRFGAPPSASAHPVQPWCTGSKSSLVFWSSVLPDAVLHQVLAVDEHVHDPRNGLIRKLTCALCESVVCALKGAVRIRSVR
jgi:hypothetical protein